MSGDVPNFKAVLQATKPEQSPRNSGHTLYPNLGEGSALDVSQITQPQVLNAKLLDLALDVYNTL